MPVKQTRMRAHESGYAVLLVAVILSILLVVAMDFLNQTTRSSQMAENSRDSAQARQMAENAANLLYGRFTYGADINGDGITDKLQAGVDPAQPPVTLSLPYVFFVTEAGAIDQTTPSLLQRVADGEARNEPGEIVTQRIPSTITRLIVNNLFSAVYAPLMYVQDASGEIVLSAKYWAQENAYQKAAVWLELVKSSAGDLNLYVSSASQVGSSKSYVQRFVGTYSATLGGAIGPLNQAG